MLELKKLDKIAYIRFTSVYRSFEDIDEFKTLADEVTRQADQFQPVPTGTTWRRAYQDAPWVCHDAPCLKPHLERTFSPNGRYGVTAGLKTTSFCGRQLVPLQNENFGNIVVAMQAKKLQDSSQIT